METLQTQCCIAGGGPAGIMLGYLLARAGVDVVVLEKHADFLRDFRGDTIHPSTLELLSQLGLLQDFLQLPHQEVNLAFAQIDDFSVQISDFTHLPTQCKFIAFMPQWDFLNFLAAKGKQYPGFHLHVSSEVTDLIQEGQRIAGVRATTPEGPLEIRAALTVAADGRHSTVRDLAHMQVIDRGAPIDVLWMRIPREPADAFPTQGRFRHGRLLITLNRGEYWQCAFIIKKGEFEAIRQKGLPVFRAGIAEVAPFLAARVDALQSWDDIKLLSVRVDYLRNWARPGLLCIGDAAHAMSPMGGVGINLAIQDAVAAANLLAAPLLAGTVTVSDLHRVQRRREYPTQMTQRLQVFAHRQFLGPALDLRAPIQRLPLPLKLLQRYPALRRTPARVLGMGFRTEHVCTPDTQA